MLAVYCTQHVRAPRAVCLSWVASSTQAFDCRFEALESGNHGRKKKKGTTEVYPSFRGVSDFLLSGSRENRLVLNLLVI